jgi:hypothetical protein
VANTEGLSGFQCPPYTAAGCGNFLVDIKFELCFWAFVGVLDFLLPVRASAGCCKVLTSISDTDAKVSEEVVRIKWGLFIFQHTT